MRRTLAILALATICGVATPAQDRSPEQPRRTGAAVVDRLAPTAHPPLPAQRSQYWYVPDAVLSQAPRRDEAIARIARGVKLVADGDFAGALPLVAQRDLDGTLLAPYARYYSAVAQAGLSQLEAADAMLTSLLSMTLDGALKETATLMLADIAVKRGDPGRAENLLEDLTDDKLGRPEDVFIALGRAEEAVGHMDHALDAYRRVYYDYPLSTQANDASVAIDRLDAPALTPTPRYRKELARAEQLFDGRRWAQAKAAFEPLLTVAVGDERELISLRLAECAYYLNRFPEARRLLEPFLADSRREAEARFFHLGSVRGAGDSAAFITLTRRLVSDHPDSDWSAEALNNLASYYIVQDDDADADAVFRQLLQQFPKHRHSERAAWKSGWTAYRRGNFRDAAEIFDAGAANFARSDYRPSWLYWSGRAPTTRSATRRRPTRATG